MKRMLKSRKAVTPVIAAVLMIMVTVLGMSFLFAFFVNYATDFRLGRGSAVLESLVIENIYVIPDSNPDSTSVDIWVYNIGEADLVIDNVYVNDVLATLSDEVEVRIGEHEKLTLDSSSVNDGLANLFKIVTLRGSAFEGRY
jgi:flagellin-like protein